MTTASIALGVIAIAVTGWLASRYYPERGKHGGAGAGALNVWQLIDDVESETVRIGRHRLRGPVRAFQGDLADDMQTQLLPLAEAGLPFHDRDVMARHPWTLRHVLAALENL
ncbi:hypothetical protein [Saccharopolyspora pogona]|uniref:hypothetical protein n=1 Tax=Saccharopolyspora pogona TaxID=333966 RepID=UPI001685DAEF|nr:hypothetical protein [Saccharopolyspora pogona]